MLKSYLLVFFVSMVPLIELRGAIPIGLGMGLPILPTYLVCVVGNMIPVPFIYLFARKFLIWGYHKPSSGQSASSASSKARKAAAHWKQGGPRPCGSAAAVRGYPAAGHRRMDWHAGRLDPGYEVQGRGQGLHGRRAAGGHHHGSGQRGPAGCAEHPVLGGLRKKDRVPAKNNN